MITDYEHLPVGIFLKIAELGEGEDNDLAIIAALAGKTEDELLTMRLTEYHALRDAASFLFYEPSKVKMRKSYKVGEWELIPTSKPDNLTTAQYIDFKELAKAEGEHTVELLSVLLVPKGCEYGEGYDVLDVREAIRDNLCILDAMAVRDFYLGRWLRLMRVSLTYSTLTALKIRNKTERRTQMKNLAAAWDLLKNGDGWRKWTPLPNSRAALGGRYIR